jgi:methylthioribose-1-phosphate isomerase
MQTLYPAPDQQSINVINQTLLPHEFRLEKLSNTEEVYTAIRQMIVRGAPLIGVTAAFGLAFACRDAEETSLEADVLKAANYLKSSRPTAVNLFTVMDRMLAELANLQTKSDKMAAAWDLALRIMEEDVEICRMIGVHGLELIQKIAAQKPAGEPVRILTHCNAGMLGCIRWGTISSPIYQAKALNIPLTVWVDETRPRNQGANLTAWELSKHEVPHTLIVDNTGGLLMQQGMVDLVLVGADRVTCNGDTANKIGTYLKALAAVHNKVPFYVCLPSTTIDWNMQKGGDIPIEERSADEVRYVWGQTDAKTFERVLICPQDTPALNYGFDITPAELITGFVTEKGICTANEQGLRGLFGK